MKYELTAKRIREAMSDMGISQQELADKSKIGKSSISHYVNGTNEPGNKSAYMLAEVLEVNPAWLMGLDVPKKIEKFDDSHIVSFFDELMETPNHNEKDIQEIRKILEKAEDSKNSEASKFYNLFLNAPAHIQVAVESLLKGSQHES